MPLSFFSKFKRAFAPKQGHAVSKAPDADTAPDVQAELQELQKEADIRDEEEKEEDGKKAWDFGGGLPGSFIEPWVAADAAQITLTCSIDMHHKAPQCKSPPPVILRPPTLASPGMPCAPTKAHFAAVQAPQPDAYKPPHSRTCSATFNDAATATDGVSPATTHRTGSNKALHLNSSLGSEASMIPVTGSSLAEPLSTMDSNDTSTALGSRLESGGSACAPPCQIPFSAMVASGKVGMRPKSQPKAHMTTREFSAQLPSHRSPSVRANTGQLDSTYSAGRANMTAKASRSSTDLGQHKPAASRISEENVPYLLNHSNKSLKRISVQSQAEEGISNQGSSRVGFPAPSNTLSNRGRPSSQVFSKGESGNLKTGPEYRNGSLDLKPLRNLLALQGSSLPERSKARLEKQSLDVFTNARGSMDLSREPLTVAYQVMARSSMEQHHRSASRNSLGDNPHRSKKEGARKSIGDCLLRPKPESSRKSLSAEPLPGHVSSPSCHSGMPSGSLTFSQVGVAAGGT